MNCKNCGKEIQIEESGEPIHTDGFFACRITGLFPSIAEVNLNDVEWDGTTARDLCNG
jgi:hypothetical protein